MVMWTWWNWSLSLALLLPSVLWRCWLGHLTRKNPSPIWPIMCLVGRTLNPTQIYERRVYLTWRSHDAIIGTTVLARQSPPVAYSVSVMPTSHRSTRRNRPVSSRRVALALEWQITFARGVVRVTWLIFLNFGAPFVYYLWSEVKWSEVSRV